MSRSQVADFSIANTTRILNGVFEYDSKRPNDNSVNSGSGLMHKLVDDMRPEVAERLTRVLMHKHLHQGRNIELARDIAANRGVEVLRDLDEANEFYRDKLANAITIAYERKKVGLFHKLLRYASITNTLLPKGHLDGLFDQAVKDGDIATYQRVLEFKAGMNKRIFEQRNTAPDQYEATVRESTQRLNRDLIEFLRTGQSDKFLELVDIIHNLNIDNDDSVYNTNADKIGFQQVKNYFYTRHTNVKEEIADKIFESLGVDPYEEISAQDNTKLINNSLIELFKTDPITAILTLGRTTLLDESEYDMKLDPHAISLMKHAYESSVDEKADDFDEKLYLGILEQFESLAAYYKDRGGIQFAPRPVHHVNPDFKPSRRFTIN